MGAHSLGRAIKRSTGYNHAWTPGRESVFDNEYYQLLVNNASMYCNDVRLLIIEKSIYGHAKNLHLNTLLIIL